MTDATLPALTTQFVQRPECTSIWAVATVTKTVVDYDYTLNSSISSFYTQTFVSSDEENKRFTTCQPSGWDANGPQSKFTFSPAVCPSGWTYYSISLLYDHLSTAWCCASGFTLDYAFALTDSHACTRAYESNRTVTATLSHGAGPITTLTGNGTQLHQAWNVQWEASDTDSLSLLLPKLTSSMAVASWVPGSAVTGLCCAVIEENGYPGWTQLMQFFMIGVPIIFVASVACCVRCCVGCKRNKKRKLKRMAERLELAERRRGGGAEGYTVPEVVHDGDVHVEYGVRRDSDDAGVADDVRGREND